MAVLEGPPVLPAPHQRDPRPPVLAAFMNGLNPARGPRWQLAGPLLSLGVGPAFGRGGGRLESPSHAPLQGRRRLRSSLGQGRYFVFILAGFYISRSFNLI